MPLIQISPNSLMEQASRIRKYNNEQADTIARIRKIVYSLEDSLKGEAQNAFKAKFISMESNYKNLSKILDKYADLMIKAAREMESTDRTARNMIHNI